LDRPIELVREDMLDGYVSVEQAETVYGVIVDADGTASATGARLDHPPS